MGRPCTGQKRIYHCRSLTHLCTTLPVLKLNDYSAAPMRPAATFLRGPPKPNTDNRKHTLQLQLDYLGCTLPNKGGMSLHASTDVAGQTKWCTYSFDPARERPGLSLRGS